MSRPLDSKNAKDAKEKMPDINFVGNPDLYKLVGKRTDPERSYMETIKVMDSPTGCHVQIEVKLGNSLSQAMLFIKHFKHKDFLQRGPEKWIPISGANSDVNNFDILSSALPLIRLYGQEARPTLEPKQGVITKNVRIEGETASVSLSFEHDVCIGARPNPENINQVSYAIVKPSVCDEYAKVYLETVDKDVLECQQ